MDTFSTPWVSIGTFDAEAQAMVCAGACGMWEGEGGESGEGVHGVREFWEGQCPIVHVLGVSGGRWDRCLGV